MKSIQNAINYVKILGHTLKLNALICFRVQVRGVEIGIVLLVLFVWACAIALFFNRWGKIRMLLPYQPEYKRDQLKVPGTGATNTCHIHHSNQVISLLENRGL